MNEPSAAAVAYGLYRTSTDLPNADQPPRHVAFVDFGSSALQVAIAAFHKGKVKVTNGVSFHPVPHDSFSVMFHRDDFFMNQMLAATFDPSLGGRSIDLAIAHQLAKGFNKPGSDVCKNKRSWIRLLAEVFLTLFSSRSFFYIL